MLDYNMASGTEKGNKYVIREKQNLHNIVSVLH